MNQPSESSTQRERLIEPATEHAEDRQLIESSGLFDPHWYVTRYPDVAGSGFDPIEHYLELGAGQGLSPGPAFDAAWYLAQNPEVAAAKLNPLLHFLRQGAREGRRPRDPLSPSVRRTAARALSSIMELDPELFAREPIDFDTLPGRDGLSRGRLYEALKALFGSLHAPYQRIVFVRGLGRGGAELEALNALSAAIELYGSASILLVITDTDCLEAKDWLPRDAHIRLFSDYSPDLSLAERGSLVRCLIQGLKLRSVLNANSRACWEAFKHVGRALSAHTDLYALLFCRDYAPAGWPCGHSDIFLRTCLPQLKRVYVDNLTFANEIIAQYGIPPSLQEKIAVVRQPAPPLSKPRKPLSSRKGELLRVFWAARICKQKSVDLLIEIINYKRDLCIDVYGTGDEVYERKLKDLASCLPNVRVKGSFASFESIPVEHYSTFLYTSLWDGMPNVLINAGALGVPIVASDVGGISELVDDQTGWLIRDYTNPLAYLTALEEINNNPAEVNFRRSRMLTRIGERHSWDSYLHSLSKLPSFIS